MACQLAADGRGVPAPAGRRLGGSKHPGPAEDQRPELINDRGRQMKAKPIQRLCEDHGLPQLFARPELQ